MKHLSFLLSLVSISPMLSAQPAPALPPDKFEIPFELHSNLIFVKAMLDGKEEYFVFDSGAPVLVLNADHFDKNKIVHQSMQAEGVGGKTDIGMYHMRSFDWNGIRMDEEDAITMSLRHLEKSAKHEFAGLIGFSLFEGYQVAFDYQNKKLSFLKTDFEGSIPGNKMEDSASYAQIPFKLRGHLPVFPVTIGNKMYKMGLDCGAGANLLYARYISDLKENLAKLKTETLKGVGNNPSKIKQSTIDKMYIGNLTYEHQSFAFEDATLTQISTGYGLDIDGLLGYEFLKARKTIVNFRKEKMFVEK